MAETRDPLEPHTPITPQQVAEASHAALWRRDRASLALGIQVLEVGPGTARLAMMVRDDMLNGLDTCHGGVISTLADSAFGCACNSYNEQTVASGFDIHLVAPAKAGDVLTAEAVETSKTRRTGLYDVSVRNQHGTLVAMFRGRSHTLQGMPLVAGLPMGKPP